jgi:hypothetical protein
VLPDAAGVERHQDEWVADLRPGELATLGVTLIEDRNGRAVVRLPNGSKTTVDYDALRPVGGSVHFVRGSTGTNETAWCQEERCGWSYAAPTRTAAEDEYLSHLEDRHPGTRRSTRPIP